MFNTEKGKKLFKIASKLNPRRKSVTKYKAPQEKYQPLIDGKSMTIAKAGPGTHCLHINFQ